MVYGNSLLTTIMSTSRIFSSSAGEIPFSKAPPLLFKLAIIAYSSSKRMSPTKPRVTSSSLPASQGRIRFSFKYSSSASSAAYLPAGSGSASAPSPAPSAFSRPLCGSAASFPRSGILSPKSVSVPPDSPLSAAAGQVSVFFSASFLSTDFPTNPFIRKSPASPTVTTMQKVIRKTKWGLLPCLLSRCPLFIFPLRFVILLFISIEYPITAIKPRRF